MKKILLFLSTLAFFFASEVNAQEKVLTQKKKVKTEKKCSEEEKKSCNGNEKSEGKSSCCATKPKETKS